MIFFKSLIGLKPIWTSEQGKTFQVSFGWKIDPRSVVSLWLFILENENNFNLRNERLTMISYSIILIVSANKIEKYKHRCVTLEKAMSDDKL